MEVVAEVVADAIEMRTRKEKMTAFIPGDTSVATGVYPEKTVEIGSWPIHQEHYSASNTRNTSSLV